MIQVVISFIACIAILGGLSLLMAPSRDEQMRRIAVEEACRTIVEAGLVASCTIQK